MCLCVFSFNLNENNSERTLTLPFCISCYTSMLYEKNQQVNLFFLLYTLPSADDINLNVYVYCVPFIHIVYLHLFFVCGAFITIVINSVKYVIKRNASITIIIPVYAVVVAFDAGKFMFFTVWNNHLSFMKF